MNPEEKFEALKTILLDCAPLAVAFSGGVDSSFLLKMASDILGDRVVAYTADSVFIPRSEFEDAVSFCRRYGIRQETVQIDVLSDPRVSSNPPDRCYHCKKTIFSRILDRAGKAGCSVVADGSNADDAGDYRPGMRALRELGIRSPLREAGLTKAEIRILSRQMELDCWDKPSMACLASRIAYGETLNADRLQAVEEAEALIRRAGIRQSRVRVHGPIARIEVPPDEYALVLNERESITTLLKSRGFSYVTLDLEGFRSGSMNEIL